MSALATWSRGPAARAVAVAVGATTLLGGVSLAGVLHERLALPAAAEEFRQATMAASALTSCLQGVRDELFLPGQGEVRTGMARRAALSRLRGCDVVALDRGLDDVHLPPAAPLIDADHRAAREAIADGVETLRRVALDARGAVSLMSADIYGSADAVPVVLAYRSATVGSVTAAGLSDRALALLGRPQTTVVP